MRYENEEIRFLAAGSGIVNLTFQPATGNCGVKSYGRGEK